MGLALGGHVIVCGHGVVDTTDTKSTTSWWDKVEKSIWPQVGLALYCRLAQNAVTRLLVLKISRVASDSSASLGQGCASPTVPQTALGSKWDLNKELVVEF